MVWQGPAGLGTPRRLETGGGELYRARHGAARHGMAGLGMAWPDSAGKLPVAGKLAAGSKTWHGVATLGVVRPGGAWRGTAGHGLDKKREAVNDRLPFICATSPI